MSNFYFEMPLFGKITEIYFCSHLLLFFTYLLANQVENWQKKLSIARKQKRIVHRSAKGSLLSSAISSIWLVITIAFVQQTGALFDPISIAVGAGIGAGLGYNFGFVKDNTYCRFVECCNDVSIPGDIQKLEEELKNHLFGQHIVVQQLVPALKAHFSKEIKPKKALVLSFHGTPGTGKNYVADFIVNSLYKKGWTSKFVHLYRGPIDFPSNVESDFYNERLSKEVSKAIADCPRSLFIFDHADMIPDGVFKSLTSLVDYNSLVNGAEYNQAIFIFLCNTAGEKISLRLVELMRSGKLRENAKISDFEELLQFADYNRDGGMKKASLIEKQLVDHYIPFLPLEKVHVYECLVAEFKRWGKTADPTIIDNIIRENVNFGKTTGLFAISGCKTLEKKVAVVVKSM